MCSGPLLLYVSHNDSLCSGYEQGLGKLQNLSLLTCKTGLQRAAKSTHLLEMCALNALTYAKCSAQCLAYSQRSANVDYHHSVLTTASLPPPCLEPRKLRLGVTGTLHKGLKVRKRQCCCLCPSCLTTRPLHCRLSVCRLSAGFLMFSQWLFLINWGAGIYLCTLVFCGWLWRHWRHEPGVEWA